MLIIQCVAGQVPTPTWNETILIPVNGGDIRMGHTIGDHLLTHYRERIGDPRTPSEVYGYWIVVLGLLLGLLGIATFLWGSTYAWGTAPFWLFREVGIVLAAIGLPVLLIGVTVRLPLQPAAVAIAGIGGSVAVIAVAVFVIRYPTQWTVATPSLAPILTYTAGILLLGVSVTLVPLVVAPIPPDQDPSSVSQPYYTLEESPEGWRWRLFASDGLVLGESAGSFDSPASARADIDRFSVSAPAAGIEVLRRFEA